MAIRKYISNHILFGSSLTRCPKVFATNYFLKNTDGEYLNTKLDKKIWVLWAEGRIHGEYEAIQTPIGNIPKYLDLQILFKKVFHRNYSESEYIDQFSIRIKKYLEKIARMEEIYKNETGMPPEFWEVLGQQKKALNQLLNQKHQEIVSPFDFE